MPRRAPPIAHIRLARSLPRVVAAPLVTLVMGVAVAAAGLVLLEGTTGVVMVGVGALVVLLGLLGLLALLTVRLDVEESAVRLRWVGGARVYPLAPGAVTRVHLKGPGASRMRTRFGLGWALGPARLRDEEEIHVVRLAPTPSAILVPTERGRLAIAAVSEQDLLDALSQAAHARARLEELARSGEAAGDDERDEGFEPGPVAMTGIERALLVERLQHSESSDAADAGAPAGVAAGFGPPQPGAGMRLPARAPAGAPHAEAGPPSLSRVRRLPLATAARARTLRTPRPSAVLVVLPLLGAGTAWGIGLALEQLPLGGTTSARLTALALVLAGPGGTIGAIMALNWWPRIMGVVVAGGLVSSVFIGRALLGP